MATKSFTTEFKFNKKNGGKLISAIENSRTVKLKVNKPVRNAVNKTDITSIMESFLRGSH